MEKKVRSSNFELLRIVAILLIILFHVQIHGPLQHINDGFFTDPIINKRLLILEIATPFGMIGNGLFLMISGYFLAGRPTVDIAKIAKKLLLSVGFVTILLTIASTVIITCIEHEPGRLQYAGVNLYNDSWWFMGYYMFVLVIAATFLNGFLQKCDQKKYLAFLLALLAIVQF